MSIATDRRITSLVDYIAVLLVHKYPKMELEDAKQDCWVEVLEVLQQGHYRSNTGAALPTFLFQHLYWRMMNRVRLAYNRENSLKAYVQSKPTQCESTTVLFHSLCQAVESRLRPFDLQVFRQYINPQLELQNFNQADLAHHFNVSEMTITRSIKAIKQATKKVLRAKS